MSRVKRLLGLADDETETEEEVDEDEAPPFPARPRGWYWQVGVFYGPKNERFTWVINDSDHAGNAEEAELLAREIADRFRKAVPGSRFCKYGDLEIRADEVHAIQIRRAKHPF